MNPAKHGLKTNNNFFLLPVDLAIIVYLTSISLVMILFHQRVTDWQILLIFNLAVITLILTIARQPGNPSVGGVHFIRHWYPMLLFAFFYQETGALIHIFFGQWFDQDVIMFERAITGVVPSVWLEKFATRPVSELLMFCYFYYYLILPTAGLALWLKQQYRAFDQMLFCATVVFFISYWGFYLYPVQGPRWAIPEWHTVKLQGWIFVPLVNFIIGNFAVHGGAMPSSHVAVALVALVYTLRYQRWLGIVLTVIVSGLLIATVFGRFHYVSDVVVGIAIAGFCLWLCPRIFTVWERRFAFVKEKESAMAQPVYAQSRLTGQ